MAEKKTDRRTLKTRRAICNALAQLLAEKELHKVTVQEIADLAEVNRVTFYKHYLDVYDLYDKLENEVLTDLGLLILRLQELNENEFFAELIGYIYENSTVFKMIFSPNSTCQMRDKFSRIMEGLLRQMQKEEGTSLSDEYIDYFSRYRVQGSLSVISKWVLSDFKEPKEDIIKIVSWLDGNTTKLIVQE